MSMIKSVRGTRDFYPEDMSTRQWLYRQIRRVSESFGYQEYDGPFLERLELYAAKLGEELVKEQSYVFSDRSGEMITLRPELTSSLARMVAQLGGVAPLCHSAGGLSAHSGAMSGPKKAVHVNSSSGTLISSASTRRKRTPK
ncbi:MAG: hypothetical protein E4G99_07100 [Anaerolineales bacterium]|nr:MAG: hypothetical protein E4G99_07100 [Anaerolineales bacterium]